MYELKCIGIGKEYKKNTNNIQKSFLEIAEEMKNDFYLGGVEIVLKKGKIESRVNLSSKKMFLFKNNEDTRKFTEDYLISQLNQLKV